MGFGEELKDLVSKNTGNANPDADTFQEAMKKDHKLAMEYIARLLRHTIGHNGPLRRRDIHKWLKKDAVNEFQTLVAVLPPEFPFVGHYGIPP